MDLALRGGLGGWSNRTTFVLALSASAVGLGSLWRFAYLIGTHGGGAFMLMYVASLFLLAAPLLVAEVLIGSHGRASPTVALRWACDRSLRSRWWMWLGVLACITGVLLLSCYAVVAGWSLAYAGMMHDGVFAAASARQVGGQFSQLLADPGQQFYWLTLFLLAVVTVVALGVRRGIGLLMWLVVPVLLLLLAALVKFALDSGDLVATRQFLFTVKSVDFTPEAALLAMGHAFFTLGVGVGTGISYGGYAPKRIPVGRSVMAVAVFDTVVALLVGIAVFPLVFANNMEPTMGPGLMFVSLPYAFGNIPQGELFGALFFLLVVVAALGAAVAILEPVVATIIQHLRLRRPLAAILAGATVWLLSLVIILSYAEPGAPQWFGNRNLLPILDAVSAGVLLPLVLFTTAVFVGWRMRPEILRVQLGRESAWFFFLWRALVRYIAPLAIAVLLLAAATDMLI